MYMHIYLFIFLFVFFFNHQTVCQRSRCGLPISLLDPKGPLIGTDETIIPSQTEIASVYAPAESYSRKSSHSRFSQGRKIEFSNAEPERKPERLVAENQWGK